VSLFITGTDTGVGKTHTVVQLLRLLRAAGTRCAGMKPICCGDRDDAALLLGASSEILTIDEINPLWLKTPAAPLAAALVEDVTIDTEKLLRSFEAFQKKVENVLVEGVGGWLVPITEKYFMSDLAKEMKLPVVVVAQNRLGCLNHALLTVRSVQEHGLKCVAVVLNEPGAKSDVATSTNRELLQRLLDVPILSGLGEYTLELPAEWTKAIAG
jgi:dethiobiotin synthetase